MNKKEIAEIRKQFTPANCAITRICGCYVDGDKNKITEFKEAFLSLPEEEMFKYFEILRKALSGTMGKNLLNMDFPLEQEKEGGNQSFLLSLRDDACQDDQLLSGYYDRIISSYDFPENYLILVIHAAYDIPGKARDNSEMFDASDEVFSFILTCICPVSLTKPGLSYDAGENCFHNRIRDWVVGMPDLGFLFPSFNERSTDIHSILYYTRNGNELHSEFTDGILGCSHPLPSETQKEVFTALVEEALGEHCDFETVQGLHQQLHELSEQQKDSPDPVSLDQGEIKNLLVLAGASEETLKHFDRHFEHAAGEDTEFSAANIINTRKFEVTTPDVSIRISADRSDLIEKRIVDGRACLVIPITDEVTVNGIRVRNEPGSADSDGRKENS